MPLSNQLKNQHLLWRTGFGPAVEQLKDLSKANPNQVYQAMKKASAKKPDYLNAADDYLKGFWMGAEEIGRQQKKKELDETDRKQLQKSNRESLRILNLFWLNEMVGSSAQLREKMAFFWHGHFACRNINVFFQQILLDSLRRNALGSFRTMLHEVSKSAAMLNFLNNNQNRKGHPNENFAREVMELFTMGRGNYTENDIKEAARAFTGWGANIKGDFVFRKFQHDDGTKTVLGKTGKLSGEDVLDILLERGETARFITEKIYKFFVNDDTTKVGSRIDGLAKNFYESDYNIQKLMDEIFTADWFYAEENVGIKIKSPVELLAGLQRMLPMKLENQESLLLIQRLLGQILFYPPNVAGWPGGKSWIDSSTLMLRMRIPQLINDRELLDIKPKDDDDQMMGKMDEKTMKTKQPGRAGKPINADVDWKKFVQHFESVPRENLLAAMSELLLQSRPQVSPNVIQKHADQSGRENFVRSATIFLMSTPEYQLC